MSIKLKMKIVIYTCTLGDSLQSALTSLGKKTMNSYRCFCALHATSAKEGPGDGVASRT